MDNKILNALGKIPALIENVEKLIKMTSEVLQRGVRARMTEEDTKQLMETMKTTIQETPCAVPDSSRSSQLIVTGVIRELKGDINQSVRDALQETKIPVEHHHFHTTAWEMRRFVEERTRNWLLAVVVFIIILLLSFTIGIITYYSSEQYCAKEYVDICWSKFTTEDERKVLWDDLYATSALPQDFQKSKDHYRQAIKRNKAILKDRERQAKENKGKFSTKIPLER